MALIVKINVNVITHDGHVDIKASVVLTICDVKPKTKNTIGSHDTQVYGFVF